MLEIKSFATRCVEFAELTEESFVRARVCVCVCIDECVLVHHRRSLCTRRAGKERCADVASDHHIVTARDNT